jgi:uncharacterized protein YlxW (UPF0749 family)
VDVKLWWLQRWLGGLVFFSHGSLLELAFGRSSPDGTAALPRQSAPSSILTWQHLVAQLLRHRRTLVLTTIAVLLGLYGAAQWQSNVEGSPAPTTSRPALTQSTIQRLEAEQAQLKQQIADLRANTSAQEHTLSQTEATMASLGAALSDQQAIAGTTPLRGDGIEILLDDSTQRVLLPSEDPDNYIVHEYQIRDIANLLWNSGAVGISVNGERFVNSTSVYCVGSTILINDTRTSPPYKIVAVGNLAQMKSAFDGGNSLADLKSRATVYGLVLKIDNTGTFTLSAFNGGIAMRNTSVVPDVAK